MADLLRKAAQVIPVENLWLNPDCGLKIRVWSGTKSALANMVQAAHVLRQHFAAAPRHDLFAPPAAKVPLPAL